MIYQIDYNFEDKWYYGITCVVIIQYFKSYCFKIKITVTFLYQLRFAGCWRSVKMIRNVLKRSMKCSTSSMKNA